MGHCILTEDTQPHNVSSNFPFLGHLQETFSIQDGQFQKGTHYFVDEHIGSGASGDCYKGSITNDSSIWCIKIVKKVSQPNGVWTFHSKRRNAGLLSGGRGCRVGLTFNFNVTPTRHVLFEKICCALRFFFSFYAKCWLFIGILFHKILGTMCFMTEYKGALVDS